MSVTQINDYSYHAAMLADPSARISVTEEDPQPGRYRLRRNGQWRPVAIWHDQDGVLRVLVGGELIEPTHYGATWISCARHAVSEDEYERLLNGTGDDPVYAKLPEDARQLRIRVERIAAIPAVIENGDDARMLADVAHVLKAIEKTCDERQAAESLPHKSALSAIKERWGVPAELAAIAREPVMRALTAHLKAKNEPGGAKGQMGRAISLRSVKVLEITDYEAALAHFVKEEPEAFLKTVETLARKALKNGTCPGAKMIDDKAAQ